MSPQTIPVYVICRINPDAHAWNEKVGKSLKAPFRVFLPHEHNPYNLAHQKIPLEVVSEDVKAMKESQIALALPEFGCDCAWETGWYAKSGKPLVFFVDSQQTWLRHWMIKGALSYVITNNKATYQVLKQDEILCHKPVILIRNLAGLQKALLEIYAREYPSKTV